MDSYKVRPFITTWRKDRQNYLQPVARCNSAEIGKNRGKLVKTWGKRTCETVVLHWNPSKKSKNYVDAKKETNLTTKARIFVQSHSKEELIWSVICLLISQ